MVVSNKLDLKIIFSQSWKKILGLVLVSSGVYAAKLLGYDSLEIDILPATILGTALSILLGFKINSAYARWWEARILWGAITNDSRSFARQLLSFNKSEFAETKKLVLRHIAFIYALRDSLRKHKKMNLSAFLEPEDLQFIENHKNGPVAILQLQGKSIAALYESGYINPYQQIQLDLSLSNFSDSQGGCERIKNTPFPNSYTFHLNLFISIYCLLLPLVLIHNSDWHTIPASVIIGYVFMSLSAIAQHLENPFDDYFYDVPVTSICRTIEVNLLEMIGEENIPDLHKVKLGFLH